MSGTRRSTGTAFVAAAMSALALASRAARANPVASVTAAMAPLLAGASVPPHSTRLEAPPEIEARAVKVGATAPSISLPAASGKRWNLEESLTGGPAVLVFYRGDW